VSLTFLLFHRQFFCKRNFKAPALKNFTLQINNADLENLQIGLADSLTTDDNDVLLAASIVGEYFNRWGYPKWDLNKNIAVGSAGQIMSPEDPRITWLGHLIEDNSIVAEDGNKYSFTTLLTTVNFNRLCDFLGGSFKGRSSNSVQGL